MLLSEYLDDKNITDAAFAADLSVSQSQVTRLKNGKSRPSLALALKIERVTKGKVRPKDFADTAPQGAAA